MGVQDLLVILLILILAPVAISFFAKQEGLKSKKYLSYLWYYHLLFGLIFILYVTNFGGDALNYWRNKGISLDSYLEGGPGTAFMHVVNYPFVHILNLSFVTGSLLYCFIGYLGILFFYLFASKLNKHNPKIGGYYLLPWIFFLPNIHFWSSGIGKDTISFFCIGFFFYCTLNPAKHIVGILISSVLVYYVRPHIAMFLLLSFGVGALLDKRLKIGYKLILSTGFAVAGVMLFDDVMEYVKLDEVSTESIEEFSSTRVYNLSRSHTGSSVDITSYPLPFKVFTFLFRPLFIDAHNITSLFASVENLILLLLTFSIVKATPISSFKEAPYQLKSMFFFVIIGAIAFSNIMGNMGIMVRMKNMFTPALLIYIVWVLNYTWEFKKIVQQNRVSSKRKKVRLAGPKFT
ncbi:hypothetical protein [Pontibacter litorisediminis]|uniref:hypothetical protein n=1 Tax=Pontibacter litorisediminis TaxID=1846260 RepID=UPI0023EDC0E6|nr:hypothetical protein [Pontibacter litorisediminis]